MIEPESLEERSNNAEKSIGTHHPESALPNPVTIVDPLRTLSDMTDPIVVVATLRPKPDSAAELERLVTGYVPTGQRDDGNLRYALHEAGEGVLVVIEQWASQAALEAHGANAAFTAFSTAAAELLASPLEVRVLRPKPIGDAAKGAL
jgi:quinol monooxygenase YgiN